MTRPRVAVLILAAAGIAVTAPAEAQIDCAKIARWSDDTPKVDQKHVFCGEKAKGKRVKGFHSQPQGLTPAGIAIQAPTPTPDPQGVYDIKWTFAGTGRKLKNSTMFPDGCTQQQVTKSIAYAATQSLTCPDGLAKWSCGWSRPASDPSGQYCSGSDGSRLTIAYAFAKPNHVKTGFPARPRTAEISGEDDMSFTWTGRRAGDAAHDRIAAFLALDIQNNRAGALELATRIEEVKSGRLRSWTRTGNAHHLEIVAGRARIEDMFDSASRPTETPLEELEAAVGAWLGSLY